MTKPTLLSSYFENERITWTVGVDFLRDGLLVGSYYAEDMEVPATRKLLLN